VRVGEDGAVQWVNAIDLNAGYVLAQADGMSGRLVSKRIESRDIQIYNLTVAQVHTYHVGDEKRLVHKCGEYLAAEAARIKANLLAQFANLTVAVGIDSSGNYVVSIFFGGKNWEALTRQAVGWLEQIGVNVLPAATGRDAVFHAEQQLYNFGIRGDIGISNTTGMCSAYKSFSQISLVLKSQPLHRGLMQNHLLWFRSKK
jgi:hypothetical protein